MEAVDVVSSCHIAEVEPASLALVRIRCLALATLKLGKTVREAGWDSTEFVASGAG